MSDHPSQGSPIAAKDVRDRVDALALRILSAMAARDPSGRDGLSLDFVRRLHAATLAPDRRACLPVVDAMLRDGIAPDEIADAYVPAVARMLGEEWCEDRIGFAAVTIGSSRLQSLLRELGPEWRADGSVAGDAPAILVVLPCDVHHTLGAMILSGQLRRRGFSVRLLLGAGPEDMNLHLRQSQFDAVMISAARGDSVASLRRLVDALRTAIAPGVRIVIGGTLLETRPDLQPLTGADLATSDIDAALRHCGLSGAQRRLGQPEGAQPGQDMDDLSLTASRATDAHESLQEGGRPDGASTDGAAAHGPAAGGPSAQRGTGDGRPRLTPVGRK